MNRPLFSHVPLVIALCPQLLACQILHGQSTLLIHFSLLCTTEIIKEHFNLRSTYIYISVILLGGGENTVVQQAWGAEIIQANVLELTTCTAGKPPPGSDSIAHTPSACCSVCAEPRQSWRPLVACTCTHTSIHTHIREQMPCMSALPHQSQVGVYLFQLPQGLASGFYVMAPLHLTSS